MIWLWLFACLGADVLPALAPPQAEVTAVAIDSKVESGEPVIVEIKSWAAEGGRSIRIPCRGFGGGTGLGRGPGAGGWA